jgi:hypothetical protein
MSLAEAVAKGPAPHQAARKGDARDSLQSKAASAQNGQVTIGPDGGEITLDNVPAEVTDWDGVLRFLGVSPEEFYVVDDTVKMSKWQQSKGTDDGERDVIWLYAYKARIARRGNMLTDSQVEAAKARIAKWKPLPRKTPGAGLGEEATFYVGWADWQIGKDGTVGEGGTIERVLDSFEQTTKRIKDLRKVGRNITSLAIANMGDTTEGCNGNYESQLFTVEMTQREQLLCSLDLWSQGIRHLGALFDDVEFISVLSNHGEWTRNGPGTRPVTSDSDNVDGFLGDAVQRVLAGRADTDHVRFTIPSSEMTVTTDMSGVRVALNHGHKAPGSAKELEWLRGQSIRLLREDGIEPRLWLTAHKHHLEVKDYGPWVRVQHPSMDHGSKWFTDTSGLWSSPGTLTAVVGKGQGPTMIADIEVLAPSR